MKMEFQERLDALTISFEERLSHLTSAIATQEGRANSAARNLKAALEGSRNDEYSRVLKAENERQHNTIVALQAELARMRGESREEVGWDKQRYFAALGFDLSELATDLQEIGERLTGSEDALARACAGKLEEMGIQIGEFADNALAYSEEAKEAQELAEVAA